MERGGSNREGRRKRRGGERKRRGNRKRKNRLRGNGEGTEVGGSSNKRKRMVGRERGQRPPIQEVGNRRPDRRRNSGGRRRKGRENMKTRRPNKAYIIKSPELLRGEGGRKPRPTRSRGNYYKMPNTPRYWNGPTCRFNLPAVGPTALE